MAKTAQLTAQRAVTAQAIHQVVYGNALAVYGLNAEMKEEHQRFAENLMEPYKNAPLTPKGREAMVRFVIEGGLSKAARSRLNGGSERVSAAATIPK